MDHCQELKEEGRKIPHVLVIPFPGQGHINPIFAFARALASNGLKVTFVLTHRVAKSTKSFSQLSPTIDVEAVSDGTEDGAPPAADIEDYFRRFREAFSKELAKLIDGKVESLSPYTAVVYDSTMPWVLEMAHERNLPAAVFFTQACAVSAVFYHLGKGVLLEYPYEEYGGDRQLSLPSFPAKLHTGDLPYFAPFDDPKHVVVKHLTDQFRNIDEVDWVLFNTFDSLEKEVVEWMKSQWRIKTVGPTFLLPSAAAKNATDHVINLQESEDHHHYMEWLDKKHNSSVVYVSFGSIASLGKEQMDEIAHGLIASNCNFLWVVRKSEAGKLLEGFASSEKGLIVNWCSQTRVLGHPAVACFMSHCGWNSTLEALSYGVPMIAVGQWVDQTTNAKFVEDVWGVGVRARADEGRVVRREEVVRCVELVTRRGCAGAGGGFEESALKWKELAWEAIRKGGTSVRNVEDFVEEIRRR